MWGRRAFWIPSRSLKSRVSASDIPYSLLTETLPLLVILIEEIHPDANRLHSCVRGGVCVRGNVVRNNKTGWLSFRPHNHYKQGECNWVIEVGPGGLSVVS